MTQFIAFQKTLTQKGVVLIQLADVVYFHEAERSDGTKDVKAELRNGDTLRLNTTIEKVAELVQEAGSPFSFLK